MTKTADQGARAREQRAADKEQAMREWARRWAETCQPLPQWVKDKLVRILDPGQP